MKGYRFYADLPGTEESITDANGYYTDNVKRCFGPRTTVKHLREAAEAGKRCNVIALALGGEHRNHDGTQEAFSAVTSAADSGVNWGGVSYGYLRDCRRIPEMLARKLHPSLFSRLDS